MKNRRRKLEQILDEARSSLERFILRGLYNRLILAAAVVVLVAVLGGVLVTIFAPGFDDLGYSIWWAFLRLSDPGYLGEDEGLPARTISTIVTVLGYVLFLGLLIAILTQWMNEMIARLESGTRPIVIAGHLLILGWTHRTPHIVLELLRTGDRAARFLQAHNANTMRVVVLAEEVNAEIHNELREHLGNYWNDRQVLLRCGSALKLEHLERVSYEDAAAIILPGEDFSNRSPGVADADTLKSLLSIARATRGDEEKPLAVAALYESSRSDLARFAYRGETEILATDQVVSRLIAQSVRYPGVWSVFEQLLSLNEGNAIFLRRLREPAKTFGELRREHHKAVPIGFIPEASRHPRLNPPKDAQVGENDYVVYVSRNFSDCAERQAAAPVTDAAPLSQWQSPERPGRVLILGWNRKVPSVLREFGGDDTEIDVVGVTPVEDRIAALAVHRDLALDKVRVIEKNFLDPERLAELEPAGYDRIILLARARMGDEAHADAATITAYLCLRHLLSGAANQPRLFVEVLEEENRALLEEHLDVLVSPVVISYMLSQIALRRELAAIFAELSRIGGPQIVLRPLLAEDHPGGTSFERLADIAEQNGEIALGLISATGKLRLNPDRGETLSIGEGDRLVTLCTIGDQS